MLASKWAIIQVSCMTVNAEVVLGSCSSGFREIPVLSCEFFSKLPQVCFLENSCILMKSFLQKNVQEDLKQAFKIKDRSILCICKTQGYI